MCIRVYTYIDINHAQSVTVSVVSFSVNLGSGPPTITLDRLIALPIEYSDSDCVDFLNNEEGSMCQFNCSVPADAYDGPNNTLSIYWEFNSEMVPLSGAIRQEIVLNRNPPHALLIFDHFSTTANGEYTCYSTNNHSSDSETVKIIGKLACRLHMHIILIDRHYIP